VSLGTAGSYSVLAGGTVANTASTTLSGDLGVYSGTSITGFPEGSVGGAVHAGDGAAAEAQADLLAALDDASSRTPHTEIGGDLGGRTLYMGVHHSTTALALTGTLTVDAQGDPDAVFIFQTDAAFETAAGGAVILANGARASNVFWVVAGDVVIGADSVLSGAILARGAITVGARTSLTGQALARDAVALESSTLVGVTPALAAPDAQQAPDAQDAADPADATTAPPSPEAPGLPSTTTAPEPVSTEEP
jgi:hypothetical protein